MRIEVLVDVKTILGAAYPSNFASGQIRSSNSPDPNKGIGYFNDTNSSQLALMYTYYGDASLDGQVNSTDFTALSANFAVTGNATWQLGDFNYDGTINALDFNAIAANYGLAPSGTIALGAVVPEPSSLGLALMLGASVKRRRRT